MPVLQRIYLIALLDVKQNKIEKSMSELYIKNTWIVNYFDQPLTSCLTKRDDFAKLCPQILHLRAFSILWDFVGVFCFNYFHMFQCNITISDSSFFNILRTKTWACPTCVPSFCYNSKVSYVHSPINFKKLLQRLSILLNPLRNQFVFVF